MPVDFLSLFTLLNGTGIRYVVTGGLAALLHGVDHLTPDVALAVDSSTDAPASLMNVLTECGYKPVASGNFMDIAQEVTRSQWMRERGMKVFSLWDQQGRRPVVDLTLDSPVAFDELYDRSTLVHFRGTPLRIASIEHLIRMKQRVPRPKDPADTARLRDLQDAVLNRRGSVSNEPPPATGTYADAERLRAWSFLQRTPEQRLEWLIDMLELAYSSGALKPRQPEGGDSAEE